MSGYEEQNVQDNLNWFLLQEKSVSSSNLLERTTYLPSSVYALIRYAYY